MNFKTLKIANLGQIKQATAKFADLTVFVGPQATGKSIFLQLFKLLVDTGPIIAELKRFNLEWDGKIENFLELYFGEGMAAIYRPGETRVSLDNKEVKLGNITRGKKRKQETVFLIPAQRVLTLREGLTRPFTDYRSGDPFAVREFSERLHYLVQSEFSKGSELFPVTKRLKAEFRRLIAENVFGEFGLRTDPRQFEKRLVLSPPSKGASKATSLPYLVWSAGQREFVPLLLGLYWLLPSTKVARRRDLEWVLIEELEMGLHPNAISVVMLMMLDLLLRGYKVALSTHSPHVLDVVWAFRVLKEKGGQARDVLDLFALPSNPGTKALAEAALEKTTSVYYFGRDGYVKDISRLDPGAQDSAESGWGGLSEFSGHVGDVVSQVVARAEEEDRQ